jgi:hypothetical protein
MLRLIDLMTLSIVSVMVKQPAIKSIATSTMSKFA